MRQEATKHDYSVTRKLDDRIFGREYELALRIISPFHPDFEKVDELKLRSMRWPTVYVIDKNGYVRFWWQGELNWEGATVDKTIEKLVNELLDE